MKKLRQIPNSYFFVKEAKGLKGIADIIGCVNGRFVALEVKRSKLEANRMTGRIVLQRHYLVKINQIGGYGNFVYPTNMEEVLRDLSGFPEL